MSKRYYNYFFSATIVPTLWQVGRLANCHTQLTRLDSLACAVLVAVDRKSVV